MWESVLGEREVCWGVGGAVGRGMGGVVKCAGVWGEARKDVWGVEKCGRVYGVSGEKCIGVWGEEWGRCRELY